MEAITNGIRRGFLSPPALVSYRVLVSMIEDAQHLGQTIIKKSVTIACPKSVTLPSFGHVKPQLATFIKGTSQDFHDFQVSMPHYMFTLQLH